MKRKKKKHGFGWFHHDFDNGNGGGRSITRFSGAREAISTSASLLHPRDRDCDGFGDRSRWNLAISIASYVTDKGHRLLPARQRRRRRRSPANLLPLPHATMVATVTSDNGGHCP
ncbi:hypothetical protein LWI28_008782 [Acer negundo]|uniref:Uncharacterized protein n=1 Tax=Acer negundo TaxID=4023 RepID=A0AAD5IKZ6_ACENE|nr:hypothetical protein LWI28_008782 [Acer negundo]